MSMMKKLFNYGNQGSSRKSTLMQLQRRPHFEPLEDRQLLAVTSLLDTAYAGSVSTVGDQTEMALTVTTETGKAAVVGIQVNTEDATFDPSAIQVFDAAGNAVAAGKIQYNNADYQGGKSSIVVLELAPGDYKVTVGGDKNTIGNFSCDVFLPGNFDGSGVITQSSTIAANAAYKLTNGQLNFPTMQVLQYYQSYGINLNGLDISVFDIDGNGNISVQETQLVSANHGVGVVSTDLRAWNQAPTVPANVDAGSVSEKATSAITKTITGVSDPEGDDFEFLSDVSFVSFKYNGQDIEFPQSGVEYSLTDNGDGTGTFSFNPKGLISAIPAGQTAELVFSYKVQDAGSGSYSTGKITVLVTGENDAPSASDLNISTDEKTEKEIVFTGKINDSDIGETETLAIYITGDNGEEELTPGKSITLEKGSIVRMDADGKVYYDPNGAFDDLPEGTANGADQFFYRVKDAKGEYSSGQAVVAVVLDGVNDAPVPTGSYTTETTEKAPKTITLAELLSKINDPDTGDTLAIVPATITSAAGASVVVTAQSVTYNPGNLFYYLKSDDPAATDSFVVTITDGKATTELTVVVSITGVNDPITVTDQSKQVTSSSASEWISFGKVDFDCLDTGVTLTYTLLGVGGGPSSNTLTTDDFQIQADGTLLVKKSVIPEKTESGEEYQLSIQVEDTRTDVAKTETITITLNVIEYPAPVIDPVSPITLGEKDTAEKTVTITARDEGTENNDVAFVPDSLTIQSQGSALAGIENAITYSLTADGVFTFKLNSAFSGVPAGQTATIVFEYIVRESVYGVETVGTIEVVISGVNDAPVINSALPVTTTKYGTGTENIQTVTDDADIGEKEKLVIGQINGQDVSVGVPVELPSGAKVTVFADGTFTYDPNGQYDNLGPGDHAEDTFTYRVKDPNNTLSVAEGTVNVRINGENAAHTVPDQTMEAASNATKTVIRVGQVQLSDIDGPDGKYVFVIDSVSGTDPGFYFGDAEGNPSTEHGYIYVITANLQAGGTYTINILVSDDSHQDVPGTITIDVVEKDAPECEDFTFQGSVLATASTGDGSTVDLNILVGPNQELTFLDIVALESATLRLKDGTTENVDHLVSGLVDQLCGVASGGSFTFIPNRDQANLLKFVGAGETLTLKLIYSVEDNETGLIGTGEITINVNGVNENPTAVNDDFTGTEILATSTGSDPMDVLANDSDPDTNDTLTIVKIEGYDIVEGQTITVPVTIGGEDKGMAQFKLENGQIIFIPNGAFAYLAAGASVNYTFSYTISDGNDGSDSANVTVKVTGENAPPTVPATSTAEVNRNASGENNFVVIDLSAKGTDPNGDALSIAKINGDDVTSGQTIPLEDGDYLVVGADGTVTYYPNQYCSTLGLNASGERTFTFQLTDGQSENNLSNTGTVAIAIHGKNDPPQVTKPLENLTERETVVEINLDEYFSDPNGDVLNYVITVGSDPDDMLVVEHVNRNTLRITFTTNYHALDSRLPVTITVQAIDSNEESVSQSFIAVAMPEKTVNVETVIVKEDDKAAWTDTTVSTQVDQMEVDEYYYIEIWVTDLANTVESPGYIKPPTGYDVFSKGLSALQTALKMDGTLVDIVGTMINGYQVIVEFSPDASVKMPVSAVTGAGTSEMSIATIGGAINLTAEPWEIPALGVDGESWLFARIRIQATNAGTLEVEAVPKTAGRLSDIVNETLPIPDTQINTIVTQVPIVPKNSLHGATQQEHVIDGGTYVRLVTTPTELNANGSVSQLPDNTDWIHEWQEHYAEIWVKASEVNYYMNALANLNYNSDYFTATEITAGQVFKGAFQPVIDAETGLISNIGGTASGEVPTEGYILLGRVKFESQGDDNVSWDESFTPHELGVSLDSAIVKTAEGLRVSYKGNAPSTELWAVAYDMNDDGTIDLFDYLTFSTKFINTESENPFVLSLIDYDRNGKIEMTDYQYLATAFVNNFSRDDYANLYFPQNFTQRYSGEKLDADNTETISTIIDAANKAWQNALGLDKPIDIQIIVKDLGEGVLLGEAQIVALDADGLPSKGIITIDDDGGGLGWYSQLDEPVTQGRYDLYTVILHEMGHVYGFTSNYDAFSAIVGQFGSQIDTAGLHAVEAGDLMSATLEAGIRKYISTLDADAILAAYDAAKENPELRDFISAPTSLTQAETETTLGNTVASTELGVAALSESSWVTQHAVVLKVQRNESIDAKTDLKLHAMGLSVSLDVNRNNEVSPSSDFVFESEFFLEEGLEESFFRNDFAKQNVKDLILLDIELEWNADI